MALVCTTAGYCKLCGTDLQGRIAGSLNQVPFKERDVGDVQRKGSQKSWACLPIA